MKFFDIKLSESEATPHDALQWFGNPYELKEAEMSRIYPKTGGCTILLSVNGKCLYIGKALSFKTRGLTFVNDQIWKLISDWRRFRVFGHLELYKRHLVITRINIHFIG